MKIKKVSKTLIVLLSLVCTLNYTYSYFSTSNRIINKFSTKKYIIRLNGNGGIFENSNVVISNNQTTLPKPTKNGYSFLGFSDSKDGSVNTSNVITNVNSINNKELFAKWNIETYSISYNLNGGTIDNKKESYNVEEDYTLPTPSKDGYTFAGWSGSNGSSPQTSVTISKGTTGNKTYTANWTLNLFVVDVNSVIHETHEDAGRTGFEFSVWKNDILVADHVIDYYEIVPYNTKIRVKMHEKDGWNIKSGIDRTFTITGNTNIETKWYDDIPPTITNFYVNSLGYTDPNKITKGHNVEVFIDAYDNGTGIQKFQNWLQPYAHGLGSERQDGQYRKMTNVLYLDTTEGRTICAYAIDWAGNEAERCQTIRIN